MKNLFRKIGQIGLLLAAVFALVIQPAQGQFAPPPKYTTALTISTAFYIPGSTTTNIPTTLAPPVPIGKNGVGFYFRVGTTNAASTTNAVVVLEQLIADGSGYQIVDDHTFGLSFPQNGTTGYDYFTNMLPTSANLANGDQLRIRSIQNTNVMGIFITNAVSLIAQ